MRVLAGDIAALSTVIVRLVRTCALERTIQYAMKWIGRGVLHPPACAEDDPP